LNAKGIFCHEATLFDSTEENLLYAYLALRKDVAKIPTACLGLIGGISCILWKSAFAGSDAPCATFQFPITQLIPALFVILSQIGTR
jgi:hypothetical protein